MEEDGKEQREGKLQWGRVRCGRDNKRKKIPTMGNKLLVRVPQETDASMGLAVNGVSREMYLLSGSWRMSDCHTALRKRKAG